MRSKSAIAGRGAGGTDILPEHSEAYASDFCGESDALGREAVSLGRKILNVLAHSVVRPVCSSGKVKFPGYRFFLLMQSRRLASDNKGNCR